VALVDALHQASTGLKALGQQLTNITATPVQISVTATAGAGNDQTDAEAIKRGQKPETVAAMRKALGI
jgi:hypothetical protein